MCASNANYKTGWMALEGKYRSKMVMLLFSRRRDLALLGQVKDPVHDLALSLCDCWSTPKGSHTVIVVIPWTVAQAQYDATSLIHLFEGERSNLQVMARFTHLSLNVVQVFFTMAVGIWNLPIPSILILNSSSKSIWHVKGKSQIKITMLLPFSSLRLVFHTCQWKSVRCIQTSSPTWIYRANGTERDWMD